MANPDGRAPSFQVPLRALLTLPFVALLVVTVASVSVVSFCNARAAVHDVGQQLESDIASRVQEHLQSFVATPHQLTELNAAHLQHASPAADPAAFELVFWQQVQSFDTVTSVYMGNPAGGLVNAGREASDGSFYFITTEENRAGTLRKFAADSQGRRQDTLTTVPDFDARTRPWYDAALEKQSATWTEAYIVATGQDMAVSASRPVYDSEGAFLGVTAVDIFLSQVGAFLEGLAVGKTGELFVMERSGLLIGSSAGERPFVAAQDGAPQHRLHARDSANGLVRGAAGVLDGEYGAYSSITEPKDVVVEIDGRRHFLRVVPVADEYGLDWLLVVVVPEDDFMAAITNGNRLTALLIAAALAVAIVAGALGAARLVRPVAQLNSAARALAEGNWDHAPLSGSHVSEVGQLTRSFTRMAGQLQSAFESLNEEIASHELAEIALRASEQRRSLALEGAELGTWDWNIVTGEVIFNERWAAMLGYSLDEIAPNVSSWERIIHPEEAAQVTDALNDHLEGRTPFYRAEHRLQTKTGGWKWVLDAGKVFARDEGGAPLRAAGIHQDITARKQAEEELRASNARLQSTLTDLTQAQEQLVQQERLAAVGQLAAGVAHDFNNMLTVIRGYTELLHTSPDMPETAREDLASVIATSIRAAELVRQILDFSRKSIRQPAEMDLATFVPEVLDFLRRTLPESVHLTFDAVAANSTVEADPTQLQQVLTNLLVNARDAVANAGTISVSLVSTSAATTHCSACQLALDGEWVVLSVRDDGPGIPSDVVGHIFEPFFTTRPVGQGAGLGLAQVLGIVHQHGGHVTVNSMEGQGAVFSVFLPPLTSPLRSRPPEALQPVRNGAGETILLVEDDASVRAVLRDMLGNLGYSVLTAANGREALQLFDQQPTQIALVISDIVMPDMDGAALANALRARAPEIPVVLASGYPLDGRGAAMLEDGDVIWLPKPPSVAQLATVVSRALSGDTSGSGSRQPVPAR